MESYLGTGILKLAFYEAYSDIEKRSIVVVEAHVNWRGRSRKGNGGPLLIRGAKSFK